MTKHMDNVPSWVRITIGILAVLNIAFGVMCYFNMSILFHEGTGIDMANPLIRNAAYEFASRNLAIGLALGFVTIIRGAPEALIILTIIRALIEIQAIITYSIEGHVNAMLLVPLAFLIVEVVMIKTLTGVIRKEESEA